MKIIKKALTQTDKNQATSKSGHYFDGQKGWLPITGYRRDGVKLQQRKGRIS